MRTNGFYTALLFPTAFILLGLSSSCTGLKCYVCNSAYEKDCADTVVPDKYLTTCSASTAVPLTPSDNDHALAFAGEIRQGRVSTPRDANFTMCRKITTNIPQQENGDSLKLPTSRTFRSCGYINPEKNNCKWIASQGTQTFACNCDSDGCNEATLKTLSTFAFLTTLFLSVGLLRNF